MRPFQNNKKGTGAKRLSPSIVDMTMTRDKDGTIWAFVSPSQRQTFQRNRQKLERKSNHFLSKREILSQLYGGEI